MKIAVESAREGGIDVDDSNFIQKAIEHALKYGKVTSSAYSQVNGEEDAPTSGDQVLKRRKLEGPQKLELDDEERVSRDSLSDALREQERDDDSK